MKTRTLILTLALWFLTTISIAQASELVGAGTASCKDYLSFTRESDKLVLLSWTQGFMSGLNFSRSNLSPTQETRELPNSEVLQALIVAFCRKNVNDLLGTASTKVFFQLPPASRPR